MKLTGKVFVRGKVNCPLNNDKACFHYFMVYSPGLLDFLVGKYNNWKNMLLCSAKRRKLTYVTVCSGTHIFISRLSVTMGAIFCSCCGYHPSILVWDLCKKGCVSMARRLSQLAHVRSVYC